MEQDPNISDRGEPLSRMEPLLLPESSRHRAPLQDLALDLAQQSAALRHSLPSALVPSLAALVRSMNCYYSNLIEGHNTHPIDIERALANDYSLDPRKRNLQIEAKAHIAVQQWIDEDRLPLSSALSPVGILEIHRRFCSQLPDAFLRIEDQVSSQSLPLEPGICRSRDVRVGDHVPVSPGAVPRFLERFAAVYSRLGKSESLLAAAAAHHRLLWIHPFLDGNGRVARLVSHAHLRALLDSGSLWSVARGLARNTSQYKSLLANCDLPRRNDLDGRGHLSEEALAEFTAFFLNVCRDQVSFMASLLDPPRLRARILLWAEEQSRLDLLPPQSGLLLDALLRRGQLPRADVPALLNASPRHARRTVAALSSAGVIHSHSSRAPIQLAFPAFLAARWLPGLFPELPV
jgi:Fic family protein